MASASVGAKASNIIPDKAIAEFDLRTTPEAPPERLFALLRKHINKLGYHLVDGPPSDEVRQQHDKIAWLEMGKGGQAVRTPMDSAVGRWTQGAIQSQSGFSGMVRVRMMGASVPTDALVDILGAPFVIMPLVNGDNNQHTFDENMRIGHYVQGVDTIRRLLTTPMPTR
jgi:acetylornithine deacetylase/succinyl-diaminopimelate desuccinylase-like protein